ncbi:MAG: dolichyl-phosphate-mannose-protein mannosyltransferase [Frankiaceae bacterium]|jgi:dolichyl-phosphate-mannose--protein O-mannosyl transferase|nr:dolichyl-phosphate-mannose-protein mannosyltransferase [Frankiaceae bacterium]
MARMSGSAVDPEPDAAGDAAGDPVGAETLTRIRRRLVRPMPTDYRLAWLVPLAITGVAAFMRFWRITRPGSKIFDETYYAHDSYSLLKHGVELDSNSNDKVPGFVVHPPLGKWMIAVGEQFFGNTPLGWRFSAAIVGSLAVFMIARIARRMFRSTLLGCVAGLLLTFDGLEFVQSRTAMLDIFLMFWVLAAFGCLVLDRDDGRRRLADRLERPLAGGDRGPWLGIRPWRIACGVCLGAATATKWDGLYWIPAFLILALWWDAGARRTAGAEHPVRSALLLDGVFALVPFFVIVAAVYTASWTGWFVSDANHAYGHDRYALPGQSWFTHDRAVLGGWLRYHWEIYDFHSKLDAAHPYLSRPYGWLLLARPVAYFYASPHGCGAATCAQEVLGIGTPAIWWLAIPALGATLWRAVGRFDWRAAAVLVAFLAGYLPWFYEDLHHRTMFLFYLLPDVPFMVLAITLGIGMVLGRQWVTHARRVVGAVIAGAYLVLVIGNFAFLYPVLSGQVITYDQWHQRMWLHNCDGGKHRNEHHELAPCWI